MDTVAQKNNNYMDTDQVFWFNLVQYLYKLIIDNRSSDYLQLSLPI